MLDNFHHLLWNVERTDEFGKSALKTSSDIVSNECYQQVRQKDIIFYFKMYDSSAITLLNGTINKSIEISKETKNQKLKIKLYKLNAPTFVETLSCVVYNGYLDRKIIKELLYGEDYLRLIEIGKKADKDGFSVTSLCKRHKRTPGVDFETKK